LLASGATARMAAAPGSADGDAAGAWLAEDDDGEPEHAVSTPPAPTRTS
jgi:hypothetical protein